MRLLLSCFLFCFVFSQESSAADLLSSWSGDGSLHLRIDSTQYDEDCAQVDVLLKRTENTLRIETSFHCTPNNEYITRLDVRIDGENLYDNEDHLAGTLTEKELHLRIYNSKRKLNFDAVKIDVNKVELFQHWPYNRNDYKFKALLYRR